MLTLRDQAQMEGGARLPRRLVGRLVGRARQRRRQSPRSSSWLRSRFFEVTHDEGALTRFALEARLSAMVFGAEPTAALLAPGRGHGARDDRGRATGV